MSWLTPDLIDILLSILKAIVILLVVVTCGAFMYDYVFQVGAFKDADSVDSLRQRLEGRGLRTRMCS